MADTCCYHCGLPVPQRTDFHVTIQGQSRPMCCPGCQAVATAIVDGGLDRFYQFRSGLSPKPEAAEFDKLAHYDLPEIQEDFVVVDEQGICSGEFVVKGITCSACAWLIEKHLGDLTGVLQGRVNVSTHRCQIRWNPGQVKLSQILLSLEHIGYEARPASDVALEEARNQENKQFLLRLGVAGLAMMQAGMVAIGLYAGDFYGIEPEWQDLLRWVSLVLVTPVVFFSARPFFTAALRSLKVRHLVMDVPVSLAIALAYSASVWATVSGSGEVYFDSVSMFTFFLLLGRYLEMRVRHRNENLSTGFAQLIPPVACKVTDDGDRVVPVKSLLPEDRIRVAAGETIPCDGEILRGESEIIESVLTGEQKPVLKTLGQVVSAGTVNVSNPLEVRVQAVGIKTRLASILSVAEQAHLAKPARLAMADRLSGWFVGAVLITSLVVGIVWWQIDPERMLWVILSVLVVTCPCALSLATPAALTVATGVLRRMGLMIRKGHVLEALASIDHCIFDKTGTLTLGNMQIVRVIPLGEVSAEQVLCLAAGLEQGSAHPIARAFRSVSVPVTGFDSLRHKVAQGISGKFQGELYALGKPDFVTRLLGLTEPEIPEGEGLFLLLANGSGMLAWIHLTDELRPGAEATVAALQQRQVQVELLSGDLPQAVAGVAASLGVKTWRAQQAPEAKLEYVHSLQRKGHSVLMVGDGINDVPVLRGADVSLAMGDAADLTRLNADSVLVSGNLNVLPRAIGLARMTRRVIVQNLGWAIAYNLIALPLACAGLVPPWAAAIGMSGSSLLVVVNALRINRMGNGNQTLITG